jgi:hypothetical protein
MLISELIGGLGNQLFQYAAGLQLSRNFGMMHYVGLQKIENYPTWTFKLGPILNPNIIYDYSYKNVFDEKQFKYDEIFIESVSCNVLRGYFQSHLYSNMVINDIRRTINERIDFFPEIFPILNLLADNESLFFHVRRGDYMQKNNLDYHGVVDVERIIIAVEEICNLKNIKIIIGFGDDLKIVDDIIDRIGSKCNLIVNASKMKLSDLSELIIMSCCGNAIIANSSFSWWGAYLSDKCTMGIVRYPDKWFNDSTIDTVNMNPIQWRSY